MNGFEMEVIKMSVPESHASIHGGEKSGLVVNQLDVIKGHMSDRECWVE